MNSVTVHRDRAVVVRENDAFRELYNRKISQALRSCSSRQEMYDAVQLNLRFTLEELKTVIAEHHHDKHFTSVSNVWKELGCGLLGSNHDRKSMQPFLKIHRKDEYVRLDAHCDMIFI